MNLKNSKKGSVFTFILIVAYVISVLSALVGLHFLLIAKLPDENIGAYQSSILFAYERAEQKLFFLEDAASISFSQSLTLLKQNQRLFFADEGDGGDSFSCGTYVYSLWNNEDSCLLGSKEDSLQLVLDAIKPRIRQNMGEMTLRYPGGNFNVPYDLSIQENDDTLNVLFSVREEAYLVEPIIVNFGVKENAQAVKTIEDVFTGRTTQDQLAFPSSINIVNSCFGSRNNVDGASGSKHMGMDLPKGEVYAAADGTVINHPPGSTGTVWVKHSDELSTRYLHLDPASITVTLGDFVKQGEKIGVAKSTGCVRSSGAACGEHLHFEVLVRSIPSHTVTGVYSPQATPGWFAVNPICFFSPEQVSVLEKFNTGNSCDLQRDWKTEFCSGYGFEKIEPTQSPISTSKEPQSVGLTTNQQEKLQQTKARITDEVAELVRKAAAQYVVDESLILGVITQESLGDPDAISSTSCAGIMQFCYTTAQKAPGLSGHVTSCKCTSKGAGCFCNRQNDRRLLPPYAIPAGAWLLRQNLDSFDDQTDQLAFAIAAYNGGPPVVRAAIRQLGNDPTWAQVSAHMMKNPQLLTYGGDMMAKAKKMKEITEYVNAVLTYTKAWNGGVAIDRSRPASIAQVRKTYGDVKKVGEYSYDPSMSITVPNDLTSYLATVNWASSTIETCRTSDDPQNCLLSQMKKGAVTDMCEEDVVVDYFSKLYQALRNCQDNKQSNCQCQLPHPPAIEGSYLLMLNTAQGTGLIRNEQQLEGLYFDGVQDVRMQEKEGIISTSLVEYTANITTFSYKDGLVSLWYEDETGKIHPWANKWLVEADNGLVFKQEKEAQMLCAPVQEHYALCTDEVKFAITLKDDILPEFEATYDATSKQVVLTDKSVDIAFYSIILEAGTSSEETWQVRESFDASEYAGKTLLITAVDLVGNEGESVSLEITQVTP